jgi:hypothetical protein
VDRFEDRGSTPLASTSQVITPKKRCGDNGADNMFGDVWDVIIGMFAEFP